MVGHPSPATALESSEDTGTLNARRGECENSVVYQSIDVAGVDKIQIRNLLGPLTNGFPRS
jgi:hypothetical protein